MVRLKVVLSAVFLSAGVALAISLFIVSAKALPVRQWEESASTAQYDSVDSSQVGTTTQSVPPGPSQVKAPHTGYYSFYDRWTAEQQNNTPDVSQVESTSSAPPSYEPALSEGTLSEDTASEGSAPGTRAPEEALSIMEPAVPYSQVVDNASSRRFSERGWKERSRRATQYGKDFSYARPVEYSVPARFKVNIPETDYYTVYARWPTTKGNNRKTQFRIKTVDGLERTTANQRRDGGTWVRLGAYEMEEGNHYAVAVSRRSKEEGRIVADAVMVVRGTQAAPEADGYAAAATGEEPTAGGPEVIQRARTHIGTPYVHSPPLPCEAYTSEDCSCFTSLVFSKWLALPDDPVAQWNMGRRVEKSDLRPGDLVFFKEAGEDHPITHVAIYSGNGYIIHASTYWGEVVERPMKYVDGYFGAKRMM